MRVMVMVKANEDSEAGVMPSEELLTEMGKYNEELVKAGVMLAGEGLQPSSKGARVHVHTATSGRSIDGPFAETKELIAGYWLSQVQVAWTRRSSGRSAARTPRRGRARSRSGQVFEAEDFGDELTPELREQEERLRSASRARSSERRP